MSLIAAASGAVVFLLAVQVIQAQSGWGVTYTSTEICALKGSTVDIRCSYRYPSRINGSDTTVKKTFWFTKKEGDEFVDLETDSEYSGRVELNCGDNDCTLTIRDLRESDSAEYKFKFITNQQGGTYIGEPGVTLSVTGLQVQVVRWSELKCHSSCRLPGRPSYVWYKNGQKIQGQTSSSHSGYIGSANSYSCAVKGHEDFPSPSVCVRDQTCNSVMYTHRSICAIKGSSVNISCNHNSYGSSTSQFWFSPERSDQWRYHMRPEDLSGDSQYAGRVQVLETERGRSTLRITDLRESDSAEYRFKFTTPSFISNSDLPGTTLTVTALQVQVTRITVNQSYTQAELKCQSSCSPAAHLSYVWFKNGDKIPTQETSSYEGWFLLEDNVSCAFQGHEDSRSPPVYAPKRPSASPSGEIVEGSSVTLTCSSDANPAANYTWYKENQILLQGPEGIYNFTSISLEDSGIYHCKSENEYGEINSTSVHIDVQYAPRVPSVSVSPSGEIVEGSSVNLTCSSDANPAANYTWYKKNEDSPKASGQNFTITDFRPEHNGNYYCEAQNTRGRHNNTLHLIVVADKSAVIMNIFRLTLVVVMLIPLLLSCLWMRKKTTLSSTPEPNEPMQTMEMWSNQRTTHLDGDREDEGEVDLLHKL